MQVQNRRMIGLLVVLLYIVLYLIIAGQIGNFFVKKPPIITITFFIIAGIIWIFPLKPLFNWMRAKPEEIPQGEKPPKVAMMKRKRK